MTTTIGSNLEHTIGAEGLLAISLRSGTVRLHAIDGDAIRARDVRGRDLEATFSIELGPGSAAFRAGRAFDVAGLRAAGRGADLEIEVPRRATVVLDGASAETHVDGLAGDQRYRTVSGDITLRGVTGRIHIEAVSGDVDITATAETSLTTRVVSGDIGVRAATLTSLEVTTTSGDLKVAGRLAGPGPFRVETVSGDALLAPVGDIRVEMTTVAGDLRSDIEGMSGGGPGRRSLVVGEAGPLVSFRSMSGDLRVVRAIPVAAVAVVTGPAPVAEPGPIAAAPEADALPISAVPASEPSGHDDTQRVPITFATTAPTAPTVDQDATDEDARIAILRSLERGEIDVTEAGRQLEDLEQADASSTETAKTNKMGDGVLDG